MNIKKTLFKKVLIFNSKNYFDKRGFLENYQYKKN